MSAGPSASRGLLQLLLPLLLLPQVGRRALGSGSAGRVCALCVPARTHPCTHRWRWDSRTAAATPPTSKSGARGEGAWPRPAGKRGRGGRPDSAPLAPGAAVPAGALPRPVGAACGTWGKWRPRRRVRRSSLGPSPSDPAPSSPLTHYPSTLLYRQGVTSSVPFPAGRRWGPQQHSGPSSRSGLPCGSCPSPAQLRAPLALGRASLPRCRPTSHSPFLSPEGVPCEHGRWSGNRSVKSAQDRVSWE